jgi:hypothetical protein
VHTKPKYAFPADVEKFLLGLNFPSAVAYDASVSAGVYDALEADDSPIEVEETAIRIAYKLELGRR